MADKNAFFQQLPFSLQEDEKIVDQVKPIWIGYMLKNSLGGIFGSIFIALFLAFSIGNAAGGLLVGLATFFIILILGGLLSVVVAYISYNKFQVWITNQRIISARGFIGYNTESMPMENINDVIMSRGIIDRILGLSSIMAVPIGGMVMMTRRSSFSTVGFIPALKPDVATKLQKDIFNLRNARKKELKGI